LAKIKIYTNESVPVAVAEGLKRRGIEAWSSRDSGNLGLTDYEQLSYACQKQAIIFTNDADFLRAAKRWKEQGKEHWGIIYVHVKKLTIGESIRRLMDYAAILEAEDMKNCVEFL
jgi:predicted nuclease of predicted toxin-antitoxin system